MKTLTMYLSLAVYVSQICHLFFLTLQVSDIRRIPGWPIAAELRQSAAERSMELFEPADSPKCARTAREEENPRWRVDQQIENSREMH